MEVSFLIFGSDVKLGGVGDLPTPQLERDSVQTLMIEGLLVGFGLVCICYYTFWSGVAGLSARLPEGG